MSKNIEPKEGELALWAESIVSGRTQEPLVNVKLGDKSIGQFTPEGARNYGLQLIEAAEAAESDAFVFQWLTRDLLLEQSDNAAEWDCVIGEFREFRKARESK